MPNRAITPATPRPRSVFQRIPEGFGGISHLPLVVPFRMACSGSRSCRRDAVRVEPRSHSDIGSDDRAKYCATAAATLSEVRAMRAVGNGLVSGGALHWREQASRHPITKTL